jgi:hypothetical protein
VIVAGSAEAPEKVLFALDVALERVSEVDEQAQVIAARKLLTRKLWRELGDLLDEPEADEGQ